jgi:hypothetical protein
LFNDVSASSHRCSVVTRPNPRLDASIVRDNHAALKLCGVKRLLVSWAISCTSWCTRSRAARVQVSWLRSSPSSAEVHFHYHCMCYASAAGIPTEAEEAVDVHRGPRRYSCCRLHTVRTCTFLACCTCVVHPSTVAIFLVQNACQAENRCAMHLLSTDQARAS